MYVYCIYLCMYINGRDNNLSSPSSRYQFMCGGVYGKIYFILFRIRIIIIISKPDRDRKVVVNLNFEINRVYSVLC